MLSFEKEEPKFVWTEISSVLADLHLGSSDWPYSDWDWNGLFFHDLKNLSTNEESHDMDERRTLDHAEITLDGNDVYVENGAGDWGKTYDDLPSLETLVTTMVAPWFYRKVHFRIEMLPDFLEELPTVLKHLVECVVGCTDSITLWCGYLVPSEAIFPQMLDLLLNYPRVESVLLDEGAVFSTPNDWDKYCTTVTEWAKTNGWEARMTDHNYAWGFEKVIEDDGNRVIHINEGSLECDDESEGYSEYPEEEDEDSEDTETESEVDDDYCAASDVSSSLSF